MSEERIRSTKFMFFSPRMCKGSRLYKMVLSISDEFVIDVFAVVEAAVRGLLE